MGRWNLDTLYTGFDTEEYKNDLARFEELIPTLDALANGTCASEPIQFIKSYVRTNEEITELVEKLAIYANLRYSANTRDTEAACLKRGRKRKSERLPKVLPKSSAKLRRL